MTTTRNDTACELLLQAVTGECTPAELQAFERHLPGCPSCRKEYEELRPVWEVLPADMDWIEPPPDLKKQVLNAAFSNDAADPEAGSRSGSPSGSRRLWRRWAPVAVAALLLIVGTLGNVALQRDRASPTSTLEEALSLSASRIERIVSLKPVDEGTERAYGVACIVDNGRTKQFVVYVFGAKPTVGEEAYQVWLIRDGERRSAGTFRVDDRGIGLLALPIAEEPPAFDAIGITIEPDDRGSQPRGARAFAS